MGDTLSIGVYNHAIIALFLDHLRHFREVLIDNKAVHLHLRLELLAGNEVFAFLLTLFLSTEILLLADSTPSRALELLSHEVLLLLLLLLGVLS